MRKTKAKTKAKTDIETLTKDIEFIKQLYNIMKEKKNEGLMRRFSSTLTNLEDNGEIESMSYTIFMDFLRAYYTLYKLGDAPDTIVDTIKQIAESMADCDNANEVLSDFEDVADSSDVSDSRSKFSGRYSGSFRTGCL
jgi:glutamine synthetase adenylyltransferase